MIKKAFLPLVPCLCSFLFLQAQQHTDNISPMQQHRQVALQQYHQADFDSSIIYWKMALTEAISLADIEWQSRFLASIATCHKKLGQYETAIIYNDSAIAIARTINQKTILAKCHNNQGTVFLEMGLLSSAHESFLKAKVLKELLNDSCSLGSTLLNLGEVELRLKDYEEAKTLYEQSLALRRSCKDTFGIISCLINLSIAARNQKDTAKCRTYLDEASLLILSAPARYIELQIIAYENEALLLLNSKQFDQAIALYEQAYELALEQQWPYDQSHCLNQIGIAEFYQQHLEDAEEFSTNAHRIALDAGILEKQLEAAENLVDVYHVWKKPEEAAHWLSEYKTLRDSLLNTAVLENIFDHGAKQELEAWRLKTDSAQTKLIEAQAKLEDTDTYKTFYMMSAGFLLAFFVGGFVLVKRNNKRKKGELEKEKSEKQRSSVMVKDLKEKLASERQRKFVATHRKLAEDPKNMLLNFPPENELGVCPFTNEELRLIGYWFQYPELSEAELAVQKYGKETRETLKWYSKCIREKLTTIDGAELAKNGKTKLYNQAKAKNRLMDIAYERLKEME